MSASFGLGSCSPCITRSKHLLKSRAPGSLQLMWFTMRALVHPLADGDSMLWKCQKAVCVRQLSAMLQGLHQLYFTGIGLMAMAGHQRLLFTPLLMATTMWNAKYPKPKYPQIEAALCTAPGAASVVLHGDRPEGDGGHSRLAGASRPSSCCWAPSPTRWGCHKP